MMLTTPDDASLYDALLARDTAYDGRVFVAVRTTGVFCRLSCPARNPKRENCVFYETVAECVEAGYRPCLRCRPLAQAEAAEPAVRTLVAALDADPLRRWTEADVASLGVDPSTARRAFRRWFGATFLEIARMRRLGAGVGALAGGERVVDAQVAAGWESGSAFRAAFARIMGRAPGSFAAKPLLMADWIETPLGPMIAVASRRALMLLEFAERKALKRELAALDKAANGALRFGRPEPVAQAGEELAAFHAGRSAQFETPLAPLGGPFAQTVWRALREIPPGETTTYGDLARALGRPTAARAVASANGANPIALMIPCHRVLGADGSLTGYGGGLWRKQRLIEIETVYRKEAP